MLHGLEEKKRTPPSHSRRTPAGAGPPHPKTMRAGERALDTDTARTAVHQPARGRWASSPRLPPSSQPNVPCQQVIARARPRDAHRAHNLAHLGGAIHALPQRDGLAKVRARRGPRAHLKDARPRLGVPAKRVLGAAHLHARVVQAEAM